MRGVAEFEFWSAFTDGPMVRISVADGRGGDFFMLVPKTSGKQYRAAREEAILAIQTAIQHGLAPGEVRLA